MFLRRIESKIPWKKRKLSVILRRQVPIRFDEEARSWLGGRPRMPERMDWPRDAEGKPLHFFAQIACADLPSDLWNGLGPRSGWLLLFVQSAETLGVADSGREQVLHIAELGPERAPPDDTPRVITERTRLRNGGDGPKEWRKWPVDLVPQPYDLTGTEADAYGAPCIHAADLYGTTGSERGIGEDFSEYGIDRPRTWRGALYFVQALLGDLDPEQFRDDFVRGFGLLDAPELDRRGFDDAFQQRVAENPDWVALGIGIRRTGCPIAAQIEAGLREERRSGWMGRAFAALDRERARHEGDLAKYQKEIDEGGDGLSAKRRGCLVDWVDSQRREMDRIDEDRAKLTALFAAYPGPDGEAAFTADIRALGEAHLAWGDRMKHRLEGVLETIRAHDLDAPLSADDWAGIARDVGDGRSVYWRRYGNFGLEKAERSLSTQRCLAAAIREDFLDFYTRSPAARAALPPAQLEAFENHLRHIDEGLPHRMGGQANRIPDQSGALGQVLLFQIAPDAPMGWRPDHFDMPCVMTSDKYLRNQTFDCLLVDRTGY